MPISVNENGIVKPLTSNILYERHLRYIPWHTKYQAITGHDCVVGSVDLFCTVDLSFVPDYVFVKKPVYNAIFSQNDSHKTSYDNWYYPNGTGYSDGFYRTVILTPVHSRHNMSDTERNASLYFDYDISNISGYTQSSVSTGFELVDNTVKCYLIIHSTTPAADAKRITDGIGFGYDASTYSNNNPRVLEFEIEAFGNCESIAV